jgi:excisionase family DNA binding protein
MTPHATTELLSIDAAAGELGVSKTTVEKWVRDKDLASFKKGKCRLISRADLTKFVILNTVRPRRPDWLTAPVESEFVEKLKGMVRQEVNAELGARSAEKIAA